MSVTIDLVPANNRGDWFGSWLPTEAEVRKMVRTYDEVDEQTWQYYSQTAGERRGTLKLGDGRTITWHWYPGGLARLVFPDGTKAFLVAGAAAFRSETRAK